MNTQYHLFSEVALAEGLPDYDLKQGDTATVVEYYPMPEDEEDGYSLEGFDVPSVTVEVAASQIVSIQEWKQEAAFLSKVRQLSNTRRLQLDQYLDALVREDSKEQKSA